MGLIVTRWRRYGQERLYVKDADSLSPLGYFDCDAGRLELGEYAHRGYEVMEALGARHAGPRVRRREFHQHQR